MDTGRNNEQKATDNNVIALIDGIATPEQTNDGDNKKKSQADILYRILCDGATEFFHDQNRTEYASVPIKIDAIDAIDGISSLHKLCEYNVIDTDTAPVSALIKLQNTVNSVNSVNTPHEIMKLDGDKFETYLAHRLFEAENKIMYSDAATRY